MNKLVARVAYGSIVGVPHPDLLLKEKAISAPPSLFGESNCEVNFRKC
jgi:hypothetical protein